MYICMLPQNLGHVSIHTPGLNRIGGPGPRTSKSATSLVHRFIFVCCPENQLLCQQAPADAMQLGHISIQIPSLFRIERVLVGVQGLELRKLILSYSNPLYIDVYLFVALKPTLVPASRCSCNAATLIAMHIPSLIMIERGLGWEPGPRTSKIACYPKNNSCVSQTL